MHILVTGGAGFIGSHLVDSMVAAGNFVTVVDNFDPFYDRHLKERSIAEHRTSPLCRVIETDLRHELLSRRLTEKEHPDVIVHLAAKAGVRPSIENPVAYQQTNVQGTQNVLEYARQAGIKRLVFASSSSVYGVNPR